MSQQTRVLDRKRAGAAGAARKLEKSRPVVVLTHGVALLVIMATYWTVDIVSPALPSIKGDLSLSAAGAGLVFSLMFFGRLLGNVPATYLLGRSGAPVTALAGSLLLAAGSAMAALSPTSEMLLVARVLQGAGVSLIVNAGLQSILNSRPVEGAAMTNFGIAATVGGVFGLQSGGMLTDAFGWRTIFGWSSILALAIAIIAAASIGHARSAISREISSIAVAPHNQASDRGLAAPLIVNFVVFTNYSIWVVLPLYAERSFDASAEETATLLMVITIVHLLAAVPVARLIRLVGSGRVLVAGLCLASSGTVLVLAAPGLTWMVVPLVLYGAGQIAAVNAGGDIVLQRGAGSSRAIGLVRLSSDLGLVIGPVVAGAMQDAFGYGTPFATLPALMWCSAIAALYLLVIRPRIQLQD
ncbi:MFS transporter [soil metagenome]